MILSGTLVILGLASGIGSCGEDAQEPPTAVPWQRESSNPVLVPGFEVGAGRKTFATADPSLLFDEEENKWKAWFNVAFDQDGRARAAVAYAESADGVAWTRVTAGRRVTAQPSSRSDGTPPGTCLPV